MRLLALTLSMGLATPALAGALVDGRPRYDGFLSGPGSSTFIAHQTLMGGLGGLSTQLVPRLRGPSEERWDDGARVAYLVSLLAGAGVGFAASSIYQSYNWMSEGTAWLGMFGSLLGAGFFLGATDLVTSNATALCWAGFLGGEIAAWMTVLLAGPEVSPSRGMMIGTGALWALVYVGLAMGALGTSGVVSGTRGILDPMLMAPGLGAVAAALIGMSYRPSVAQLWRVNTLSAAVGGGVFLLSALVMSAHLASPVPYVLGAAGAAGTTALVSVLWHDEAAGGAGQGRARAVVWW